MTSRRRFAIDSGTRIDINSLVRDGFIAPDRNYVPPFKITYGDGSAVAISFSRDNDDPRLTLEHDGGVQYVPLTATEKPYGGRQWYFLCPRSGRRVSVLWRPAGATQFASRHAYRNAAYAVQFLDPAQRAWRTMRRAARRLGSTNPNDYDLPEKPLWMRWHTYDRIADQHDAADRALTTSCALALTRFLRS
jgi:hypothetical protein